MANTNTNKDKLVAGFNVAKEIYTMKLKVEAEGLRKKIDDGKIQGTTFVSEWKKIRLGISKNLALYSYIADAVEKEEKLKLFWELAGEQQKQNLENYINELDNDEFVNDEFERIKNELDGKINEEKDVKEIERLEKEKQEVVDGETDDPTGTLVSSYIIDNIINKLNNGGRKKKRSRKSRRGKKRSRKSRRGKKRSRKSRRGKKRSRRRRRTKRRR